MTNAVEIRGLCKSFGDFGLKDIDLDIPQGYVVGLIGENGAGKTSLIKCMTGACITDSGEISFPGSPDGLCRIGAVFDECHFFRQMTGRDIGRIMEGMSPRWDQGRYEELMASFGIGLGKRIAEYSRGMGMKIQTAVALAGNADLLLFDEATAGMDPAARDEFLDLVMGYMQDEGHSVLMSSHITSDLERVADYIVFLHKGRIILSGVKDEILDGYGLVKGSEQAVLSIGSENIVRIRRDPMCTTALVADRHGVSQAFPELVVDPASLDDIMVMVIRGEQA